MARRALRVDENYLHFSDDGDAEWGLSDRAGVRDQSSSVSCLHCHGVSVRPYQWQHRFPNPPDLVSSSAWVAITKYHSLDGLNNRHVFLSSAVWKSKTKVPVWSDSAKSFLFLTFRWSPSHCDLTWQTERHSGVLLFLQGHSPVG